MLVPFTNLSLHYQPLTTQFIATLEKHLENSNLILGQTVADFEIQFANFCHKPYCVTVNSGTDALTLALLAYDIGPGDEVITAPNSFFATAESIHHTGAKVVFADISSDTYTLDPRQVAQKITSKTKAIIPVHLYGQPADMDPLIKLAKQHHLHIIEDCCQAHGAQYNNRPVPYTATGIFSFVAAKNLGSLGDGGAIVTNQAVIAKRLQYLRNHGSLKKYHHQYLGFNSRLDALQAAFLSLKLPHLSTWNRLRQQHAALYSELLQNLPQLTLPQPVDYANHVYHLYVIRTLHRDRLQTYLESHGISTVIHYPIPIHLQPPYRKQGYRRGDFPITESLTGQILSLPLFPELTKEQIKYVCQTIKNFYPINFYSIPQLHSYRLPLS